MSLRDLCAPLDSSELCRTGSGRLKQFGTSDSNTRVHDSIFSSAVCTQSAGVAGQPAQPWSARRSVTRRFDREEKERIRQRVIHSLSHSILIIDSRREFRVSCHRRASSGAARRRRVGWRRAGQTVARCSRNRSRLVIGCDGQPCCAF